MNQIVGSSHPHRRGQSIAITLFALALTVWSAAPAISLVNVRHATLPRSFELVDADGKSVDTATFKGKWLLIYFGYTNCADLCPTGLSTLATAIDELGPAARFAEVLFVTVDPERDFGPMLRTYATAFHPRLMGLGGASDEIKAFATALGVKFERVLLGSSEYTIAHSATFSLVQRNGRAAITFDVTDPHAIAAKLLDDFAAAGLPLDDVHNRAAFR